jgi:hypothetical protein
MARRRNPLNRATERRLAAYLFNRTWEYLVKKRRTPEEEETMLHLAHASRYHWGVIGRPRNRSIAEWQLSRVYSALGRAEPATVHGGRALDIAIRSRLSPFYVAYGHEALARAAAVARDRERKNTELRRARALLARIREARERTLLEEDLATIR